MLGDARYDVFRSKDFCRVLRAAQPPLLAQLAPLPDGPSDADKRLDAQIASLGVRRLQWVGCRAATRRD